MLWMYARDAARAAFGGWMYTEEQGMAAHLTA
jgi:hypothetical protein